jgi:hypothetical protein
MALHRLRKDDRKQGKMIRLTIQIIPDQDRAATTDGGAARSIAIGNK